MKCVLSFVFVTAALLQFAAAAPVGPGESGTYCVSTVLV